MIREKNEEIERRLHGPQPLPESLPPAEDAEVAQLLSKRGLISKIAREQVTDKDIARLRPHQWLNDEIINFYGQMILTRSEEAAKALGQSKAVNGVSINGAVNGLKKGGASAPKDRVLDIHYFSTFFWSKLIGEGYEKARLAKWTKKVGITCHHLICTPHRRYAHSSTSFPRTRS